MTTTPADDFLLSGGSPSAKFPNIGATVTGTVARVGDPMQQRDYANGNPKFWDDGSPMMQLPVDLATAERDPEIVDDDGTRTIYIKGQMKKAIADAVRAAGARGLAVGGTLTVTYASDGEVKKAGFNPPKIYTASYTPPAPATAEAFLDAAPAAPQAAQPAPAVATPPPDPAAVAAALAALTPEQRKSMGLPG